MSDAIVQTKTDSAYLRMSRQNFLFHFQAIRALVVARLSSQQLAAFRSANLRYTSRKGAERAPCLAAIDEHVLWANLPTSTVNTQRSRTQICHRAAGFHVTRAHVLVHLPYASRSWVDGPAYLGLGIFHGAYIECVADSH